MLTKECTSVTEEKHGMKPENMVDSNWSMSTLPCKPFNVSNKMFFNEKKNVLYSIEIVHLVITAMSQFFSYYNIKAINYFVRCFYYMHKDLSVCSFS